MKAKISVILRVTISAGLIAFLVWSMRGHFPEIRKTLARTNLALFAIATLIFVFNVIVFASRLKLLTEGEGLRISFGSIVQLSFIGFFFNNFMPTAVGGDIVKAYYASRETRQTAKSFIAVFMDRFVGLFSLFCIATIALFLSWQNIDEELKKFVLIFTIAGIAAFVFIMNDSIATGIFKLFSKLKMWNIGEKLSKVYRAVHEYRSKKALILMVIGVSVVSQSIYFSIVYVLAKSLGSDMAMKTVFLLMPIVSVISMLPSLGGLGLREGAIVAFFGPIIGTDNAFSISILFLATLFVISLLGGIVYLTASQFKIKVRDLEKEVQYD